jgi:hypothetical protein
MITSKPLSALGRSLGKILAGFLILSVAACGSNDKFKYKMTVELETPAGARSGFAVREVRHYTPPSIPMLGESRPRWAVTGEAVAVDIAPGETLYALLPSADGDSDFSGRSIDFLLKEFGSADGNGSVELWPRKPQSTRPKINEPAPLLVTFRDADDPRSVEQVAPEKLTAAFGPGIKLRRIAIQKTEEAVTSGISRRLGWLGYFEKTNKKLSGSDRLAISSNALADNLSASSFIVRNQ